MPLLARPSQDGDECLVKPLVYRMYRTEAAIEPGYLTFLVRFELRVVEADTVDREEWSEIVGGS